MCQKTFRNWTMRINVLLVLLVASLACGLPVFGDPEELVALEQTKVALRQTQTAMAIWTVGEPATEVPTLVTEVPTEVVEVPTTGIVADVDYEGISFSFDASIVTSVSPNTVAGQNLGADYMPGETYPTYYEFTFTGYALADTFHSPVIRIYPIADYEAISTQASDIINSLRTTLNTQPDAGINVSMPFLPMWNAGQMFSAYSSYFPFQNGKGVRYLTMYGQAYYPIDNTNLFYTYQGISSDGKYYVSAIMPISNLALPLHGEDSIDDWNAFYDYYEAYISQAVMQLNEYPPDSFAPAINMLDAMMASLLIKP